MDNFVKLLSRWISLKLAFRSSKALMSEFLAVKDFDKFETQIHDLPGGRFFLLNLDFSNFGG